MNAAGNRAAFGPRGTFAMIAAGFVAFVALLAMIGTGVPSGNTGGAHGLGKGIAGYAALAAMLRAQGHPVGFNRLSGQAGGHELRILTPLANADAKDIAAQINPRRAGLGPTILVTPKWITTPLPRDPRPPTEPWGRLRASVFGAPRPPPGWTTILGAMAPRWNGVLDRVMVSLGTAKAPPAHGWRTADGSIGRLPDDRVVLSGGGTDDAGHPLVPLVRGGDGRILAGYFADGGSYPALDAMAGVAPTGRDTTLAPLVIVFDPDLLNNRGMADRETGLLAQRLVQASAGSDVGSGGNARPVVFDLVLAGLGASPNLLTLAFTPPFLAATICLILAMAGSIWRGFTRFGPPIISTPADPVGRIALVDGGAALLLRARRYHLIGVPYADALRERLVLALGLPRQGTVHDTDAAIERIQRVIAPGTVPFGEAVANLATARRLGAITAQASALHAIESALVVHPPGLIDHIPHSTASRKPEPS